MAVRFYLSSDASQDLTPAFDASWESTVSADRVMMKTVIRSHAFVDKAVAETSTSGTFDVLIRQYISDPIAAITISGTVKGVIRALESAADADMRAQMVIRVFSFDCTTVRGTLIASDASALASEWDATTLTNRKFPLAWTGSGTTVTSVAAQDGDRIVIELGYRAHNTTATSKNGTLRFGDASATDLAENETGTADDNPWVEFSDSIVFLNNATSRRGTGNDLFVEVGSVQAGPENGRGNSYADVESTVDAVPFPTASRRKRNPFFALIGVGLGPQSGKGNTYADYTDVPSAVSIPSIKRPGPIPGSETGAGEPIVYQMQAKDSVTGVVFTWIDNTPDFVGSGYPGPNLPLQISIRQTSRPQC